MEGKDGQRIKGPVLFYSEVRDANERLRKAYEIIFRERQHRGLTGDKDPDSLTQ